MQEWQPSDYRIVNGYANHATADEIAEEYILTAVVLNGGEPISHERTDLVDEAYEEYGASVIAHLLAAMVRRGSNYAVTMEKVRKEYDEIIFSD